MSKRETQKKGDTAVAMAIAYFTSRDLPVSLPVSESLTYDLIVDIGDSLKKVQVKFSSSKSINLRNVHHNSQGWHVHERGPKDYDWLFVLRNTGEMYLVKAAERFIQKTVAPKEQDKITL